MKLQYPLQQGRLIKRYKRFLADVACDDGREITIHCPNTGSMTNCNDAGSRVWFWDSQNPKRKYAHTWEFVEVENQYLACVNTGRANGLVAEAISNGTIVELQGYDSIRAEVKYGEENSRIDLLLEDEVSVDSISAGYVTKDHISPSSASIEPKPRCYVEVKNVTLLTSDSINGRRVGAFPDAVSARGAKHLRELISVVANGDRGVLVFCVAHTGINAVIPADNVDPLYGETLRAAVAAGVEVYAYGACIDVNLEAAICLNQPLPVIIE